MIRPKADIDKVMLSLSACIAMFSVLSGRSGIAVVDSLSTEGARNALHIFAILAFLTAIYLLVRSARQTLSGSALVGMTVSGVCAVSGYGGIALTIIAMLFVSHGDLYRKAAGTVMAAIAVQAVWAPFLFYKFSSFLLPLDASASGYLLTYFIPGADWAGNVIKASSDHSVRIVEGCSSFHNLSLASLVWISITMMLRPYWVKYDLGVGAVAAVAQIACNETRLLLVSMSRPMFDYWHEGTGAHLFAGAATLAAILIASFGAQWAGHKAGCVRQRTFATGVI